MRHICYVWQHENAMGKMGQFLLWPFLAGWGAGFLYIRIVNWWGIRFERPDDKGYLPFGVRLGFVKSIRIGRTHIWMWKK